MGSRSIVLVHGAWADGSSWRKVMPALAGRENEIHAAQLGLVSFSDDVEIVRRLLSRAEGPVTLVGHSYGGAVISAAGQNERVRNLVFVAAYAPEEGETVAELRTKNPPYFRAPALKPDQYGLVWMNRDGFQNGLAHDVGDPFEQQLLFSTQKPISPKIFTTVAPAPAWRTKSSFYLQTANDRIANPITQKWMAERAKSKITTLQSGHLPLLNHPEAVAAFIVAATEFES